MCEIEAGAMEPVHLGQPWAMKVFKVHRCSTVFMVIDVCVKIMCFN